MVLVVEDRGRGSELALRSSLGGDTDALRDALRRLKAPEDSVLRKPSP